MDEDASRIRKNPGILARTCSFTTNILRANGAGRPGWLTAKRWAV